MKRLLLLAFAAATTLHAATQITWQRQQLHGDFYSEGAAIGDINGDGKADVVAGPFWWEGPEFEKKHAYYEPKIFSINGYSDNFFAYVYDFNADQKNDILILGFPGKEARLYLNPGVHDDKPWPMHIVADVVDNESPVFTDITGDGKPEIVCSTGGWLGWFEPDWENPTQKWHFTGCQPGSLAMGKFTHGLGVGDVNGDGRLDLLEARRWWEQPEDLRWHEVPFTGGYMSVNFHPHTFAAGVGGGAQMFAYDFDGNGTNDVFTSLSAHRYGVAVFLQNKHEERARAEDNHKNEAGREPYAPFETPLSGPHWTRVMLASEQPQDNDYGIVFSQPHAAYLADIDGDGVKDIVTGKRYWAHNGHDPDERGHRVIYWYQTKRDGKGGVDFVPHLVDAESGVGVDVQVGDVNGDKLPDIVVANKAGVFILTQERKETTVNVTPKKMYGPGLMAQKDYAHGQSPQEAVKALQLPGGFKAELIAAEPDLVQPIAFTFDERGRIWVVEGNSYPKPREVGAGQDRIKILEDKDGDGVFETKKIFCEGLNLVSGIELGFGGVWVGAAPYLMFIPDRDHDDKPDAAEVPNPVPGLAFKAQILLDGWGSQDTHETLNSFIWGPDGWLYGCHGVFTHSRVGKPGTPDDQRKPINAGVWRYHPVRHEFEIFAEGTSNPWGLDYDQHGEFFVTACVIPHLYHIVPGGRYQRQAGQHFNPYTYDDIKTIADHAHYAGNIRDNAHWGGRDGGSVVPEDTNAMGGGHAHCGLAIYQSSLFPPTYRNQLIFGNLHGHRLVTNYTDPHASSYVGKHGSDFMRANDLNFIPVTQKVGPDGALYVSDWSDTQICHRGSNAVEKWDRSNGRIYRVSYAEEHFKDSANMPDDKGRKPESLGGRDVEIEMNALRFPRAPFDFKTESDVMLAKFAVQTKNEWCARMARRVLMEKAAAHADMSAALKVLQRLGLAGSISNPVLRTQRVNWELRASLASWCIQQAADPARSGVAFYPDSPHAAVAAWGVRMSADPAQANSRNLNVSNASVPVVTQWPALMKSVYLPLASSTQTAPIVRRELASVLQRLPQDQRPDLATSLLKHGEDKDDPMIPLLIWYGIEPLVGADPKVGLELARASKLPKVTEFIYRRLSSDDAGRASILSELTKEPDAAKREATLVMILNSARNSGKLNMPRDWAATAAKLGDSKTVWELSALFGDEAALKQFRERLAQPSAPAGEREHALGVLIQAEDAATAKLLQQILQQEIPASLRRKSIQALASLKDAKTPKVLGALLPKLSTDELPDAINTLASTKEGAKELLKAVEAKAVPATALSPFLVRQLTAFDDQEINVLIKTAWGDVNAPKADLEERTKKYKALLTPAALAKGDLAKGKMLFTMTCGACHKLFGEGQNVGPDITGSNRADLNYLLENVLDPNAVIGKAYQLNLFTMKDGRVMSGVIKEESAAAVKMAMMGGIEFTLPQADIAKREVSKLSTMPEGLFDALKPEQVIDLVKYLQSGASGPAKGATTIPGAIEGEALKVLNKTGGNAKPQGMGGFGSEWSGASQLWWTGGKPGQKLTLALPVKEGGKYQLKAALTLARDYGIIDVTLDDQPVATAWDGYNGPKVIHSGELDWGTHELSGGEHRLTFTITGKHPDAVLGYMVGLDYVRLEKK